MSLSEAPPLEQVLAAIAANYLRGDSAAHQFLEAYRDSGYSWEGIHHLLTLSELPPSTPTGLSLELVHHFSSILIVTKMELHWRKLTDEKLKQDILGMLQFHLHNYCCNFTNSTSNLQVAIAENLALAFCIASIAANEMESLFVSSLKNKQISSLVIFSAICSDRVCRTQTQRQMVSGIIATHLTELKLFIEEFMKPLLGLVPTSGLQLPTSLQAGLTAAAKPEACPLVSIQSILSVPAGHVDMDQLVQQILPITALHACVKALLSISKHLSTLSDLQLTDSLDLIRCMSVLMHTPLVADVQSGVFVESLSLRSYPPSPKDNDQVSILIVMLLEIITIAVRKLSYMEFSPNVNVPDNLVPHIRVLVNVLVHFASSDSFTFTSDTPAAFSCTNVMLILLTLPSRSFTMLATDYFAALQSVPTQQRGQSFHERLFLDVMVLITTQTQSPELCTSLFGANPAHFCLCKGQVSTSGLFNPLSGTTGQPIALQAIAPVDQEDGLDDRQLATLMQQLFEDAFCVNAENILLQFLRVLGIPVSEQTIQQQGLHSIPQLFSAEAFKPALYNDQMALKRVLVACKSLGIIAALVAEDFDGILMQKRDSISEGKTITDVPKENVYVSEELTARFVAVETLLRMLLHHVINVFDGVPLHTIPSILIHCLSDSLCQLCAIFPVSLQEFVLPTMALLVSFATGPDYSDPQYAMLPVLPACKALEAIVGSCTIRFHRPPQAGAINMDSFQRFFSAQHINQLLSHKSVQLRAIESIQDTTIYIPLQLPPAICSSIAACVGTTLSRLPSTLSYQLYSTLISSIFSTMQQVCQSAPSPQSCVQLLSCLTVVPKLVYRTNVPNIDIMTGQVTTLFGVFTEDKHSVESAAKHALSCFLSIYHVLITHIKALFTIPFTSADMTTSLKQIQNIIFPDDLRLPVAPVAVLFSNTTPTMQDTLLGCLASTLAKFSVCASESLGECLNSLLDEILTLIQHSRALPMMTSFLTHIVKLVEEYASKPAHYVAITKFLVAYTHAVSEWAGNVAEHAPVYTIYTTCLHRLTSTKLKTESPAAVQMHPYGGVALHQNNMLPQIYTILTTCLQVADVERALARSTLDAIVSIGASCVRDLYLYKVMLGLSQNNLDRASLPRALENHVFTTGEQQYNESLSGSLRTSEGIFTPACIHTIQQCLYSLTLSLAGTPDVPQELFNRVGSALLSILTMLPDYVAVSSMEQVVKQLPCTHINATEKISLTRMFTSPTRSDVQGDMYSLERKYRMFIRDAAVYLRTTTASIDTLEDYLQ